MKILLTILLISFTAFSSFAQDDPSPEEFIEIDVEPKPLVPLLSLVRYPEEAKDAGKEGKVIISVLINESGKVTKTQIEKSSDPIFDKAAKDALMAATFSPALQKGKPVKIWYTVPIVFKLLDEKRDVEDMSPEELKHLEDSLRSK